jgi:hypothetical protein
MANKLYEFTMKVAPTADEALPGGASGALVPTYAAAPDHETALRLGVGAAAAQGLGFRDLEGQVREIPPAQWSSYVSQVWPDHAERLPTQQDLTTVLAQGGVFFGPILTFDA